MNQNALNYIAVAIGGSLGAVSRLAVGQLLAFTSFPLATLTVNIVGSLFLGWFTTAAFPALNISPTVRIGIAVGFVGAFTTFSTYMLDVDKMMQGGSRFAAIFYLVLSIVLGLAAVRLGIFLATRTA